MDLIKFIKKSSSSSIINNVASTNNKPNNMQLFVNSFIEYKQHRTDKLSTELIRYLQLLSVTIDYSIFDPSTSDALDFFLSLQELLAKVEQHSTICWCCVNVLKTACKNPMTRTSLINNYHFLSPLCELLNDQLETEKKIKLLRLMQELTCGITISWQISYLPLLITTLSKWIINENEDIIILCLAILVNVCYKNLPCIYTLCRCVDVKSLLRHCINTLEGPKVEMQVCKLLIILEYMDGSVPKALVKKLIMVLFSTIFESFNANDSFYLRHSLDFFMDFRVKHTDVDTFLKCSDYEGELKNLLQENLHSEPLNHDPDCITTFLSFLNTLVQLLTPSIFPPFYRCILRLCLQWIHTDIVSTQALVLMRTIIMQYATTKTQQQLELAVVQEEKVIENNDDEHEEIEGATVDEVIIESLPLLRVIIECVEEVDCVEDCKKLVAVVELLRVLLGMEKYKEEIIELLQDVDLVVIFEGIINGSSDNVCVKEVSSMEAVTLYVNYMAIINELSRYQKCWLNDIISLLKHKQIHNILSQALYQGNESTKRIVLTMASTPCFPIKDVAKVMTEMSFATLKTDETNETQNNLVGRMYPNLSMNQNQRLDDMLDQIRNSTAEKGHLHASATEIVELYDYKIACLRESEEMSQSSVNSASEQCVQYQTKVAQLTAEVNKLQLRVITAEERYDNVIVSNEELKKANEELAKRVKEEHRERLLIKDESEVQMEEKKNQIKEMGTRLDVLKNTLIYTETKAKRNQDKLLQDIQIKDANHADTLKAAAKLKKDLQAEHTSNEALIKKMKDLDNRILDKNKALDKSTKEIAELQERLKIILKVITK